MVLATALSPVRGAAISGLIKLTLNVLLFLLMARILRHSRARTLLVLAYVMTSLPVSVFGLRQYFFGAEALATWVDAQSTLADATRIYSFLGNPNLLAGYLIPAVMFSAVAFFAWPRWVPKGLALLATLINTLCLVLTLSRGGWIGFMVAGFVLMTLLVQYWSIWFTPLLEAVGPAGAAGGSRCFCGGCGAFGGCPANQGDEHFRRTGRQQQQLPDKCVDGSDRHD